MAKGKYEQWLTTEGLLQLEAWARDGLTDEQIAHNMGIGTTTFYRWKNNYREIRESLKKGKEDVDIKEEQKIFCDEYLINLNATRAYKAAYKNIKNDETAAAAGSRLLRNVKVQNYIKKKRRKREKRTKITQDKVLEELGKIGFANLADYARVVEKEYVEDIRDEEGNVIGQEVKKYLAVEVEATANLDKDKQAAIAVIKHGPAGIEVKLYDKLKALELIGRHLGMFNDKLEVQGNVNTNNPFADLTTEELKKLIVDED